MIPVAAERNSPMGKRRRMTPRQLKALIETGHYSLEPVLVAEAMLERPGVRALLSREGEPARTVGRSPALGARGRREH